MEYFEKIRQIREFFCNGNNVDFASKMGMSASQASDLCNGHRNPGKGMLEKILTTFPEVSRTWLYFGEGPMLRTDNSTQHNTVSDNSGIIVQHGGGGDTYNNHAELMELVLSQQKTIQELTEQNKILTQIIASKI